MRSAALRRPTRLIVVLLGLAVAACSGGDPSASPTASTALATRAPTPVPTPKPTPSPPATAKPTARPTAKPAPIADATKGLKIAKPYSLTALEPALAQSFGQEMSALAGAFPGMTYGGRLIVKGDDQVGHVFVVAFPKGVLNDTTYRAFVNGIDASSRAAFVDRTVSGVTVRAGTDADGVIGVYRDGDLAVIVGTFDDGIFEPVVKALIAANQ